MTTKKNVKTAWSRRKREMFGLRNDQFLLN